MPRNKKREAYLNTGCYEHDVIFRTFAYRTNVIFYQIKYVYAGIAYGFPEIIWSSLLFYKQKTNVFFFNNYALLLTKNAAYIPMRAEELPNSCLAKIAHTPSSGTFSMSIRAFSRDSCTKFQKYKNNFR